MNEHEEIGFPTFKQVMAVLIGCFLSYAVACVLLAI